MNIKVFGIIFCMMLLAATIPATTGTISSDEIEPNFRWHIFIFMHGRIQNLSKEEINNASYINCTAIDVKYFWLWLAYPYPLWLEFERRRVFQQEGFLIAEEIFHGILTEGLVFGIMYNSGNT